MIVYNQKVYFIPHAMTYTIIPSVKGQVTVPVQIRNKYNINQQTPLIVEDKGNGLITLKITHLVNHEDIDFYDNEKETGLTFKKGIDPKVLIKQIEKLDG